MALLPDHDQVIDVPFLVAGTETMKPDLIFPVDVYPETVLGVGVEGAKRAKAILTCWLELDVQQLADIRQGLFKVDSGFQIFVVGNSR